jgi:hypothetical protein
MTGMMKRARERVGWWLITRPVKGRNPATWSYVLGVAVEHGDWLMVKWRWRNRHALKKYR